MGVALLGLGFINGNDPDLLIVIHCQWARATWGFYIPFQASSIKCGKIKLAAKFFVFGYDHHPRNMQMRYISMMKHLDRIMLLHKWVLLLFLTLGSVSSLNNLLKW
jgi:hypothetical protein